MTAYSLSVLDPSFEASEGGIIRSKVIPTFCITRCELVLSGASPLHTILRRDVAVHLSPLVIEVAVTVYLQLPIMPPVFFSSIPQGPVPDMKYSRKQKLRNGCA